MAAKGRHCALICAALSHISPAAGLIMKLQALKDGLALSRFITYKSIGAASVRAALPKPPRASMGTHSRYIPLKLLHGICTTAEFWHVQIARRRMPHVQHTMLISGSHGSRQCSRSRSRCGGLSSERCRCKHRLLKIFKRFRFAVYGYYASDDEAATRIGFAMPQSCRSMTKTLFISPGIRTKQRIPHTVLNSMPILCGDIRNSRQQPRARQRSQRGASRHISHVSL